MLASLFLMATLAGVLALPPKYINYKYYLDNPYTPLMPGDYCNGSMITDDVREEFLDAHNHHRSRVARGLYQALDQRLPPAADMIQLRWSCDLERAAQAWADQCEWKHDKPLPLHSESLWRIWGPESYLQKFRIGVNASARWAHEFEELGMNAEFHKIGHAMLMTYSDQFLMGCGYSRCKGPTYTHIFAVCRYFSNGQRRDGALYRPGEPMTSCPAGYSGNNATALCEAADSPLPPKRAPDEEQDPFSIFSKCCRRPSFAHVYDRRMHYSPPVHYAPPVQQTTYFMRSGQFQRRRYLIRQWQRIERKRHLSFHRNRRF